MKSLQRTISALVFVLSLFLVVANCQQSTLPQYGLPSSLSRPPSLQVDGSGRVFVGAGDQLIRLDSSLVPQENLTLASEVVVNILLSSDGSRLVVCLTDLSCAVYNATDFSTGPDFSRAGALVSLQEIALFATEDSFYVGSVELERSATGFNIVLGEYGLNESRTVMYNNDRNGFERVFYGGFVRGRYAYYFVSDDVTPSATNVRALRVMRVCDGTPQFSVLYETQLTCGGRTFTASDRLCGLSEMESFSTLNEPTVVVTRCREGNANLVCLFTLTQIDNEMDRIYDGCSSSTGTFQVDVAWFNTQRTCSNFQDNGRCDFSIPLGDINAQSLIPSSVVLSLSNTEITASVAVTVESFSLMFIGYISNSSSGEYSVGVFDVTDATSKDLSDAFDVRQMPSQVRQLQWKSGLDYVYVATETTVTQVPVEECASSTDCTSCLTIGNPLCGWCIVENKCSRRTQCQNVSVQGTRRWIPQDQNTDQCFMTTITPSQFVFDRPEILSVSVSSPGLPVTLPNETYQCHFQNEEMALSFVVPAEEVTANTNYSCNITGRIPAFNGVKAEWDFSFQSSVVGIPFGTNQGAVTTFQCDSTSSCSECLQTDNACGWCNFNKVCSGTSAPCLNEINFLQLSGGESFEDVCPLVDLLPTGNYTQPVNEERDIQLVTRNLPAPIDGFSYTCRVNGISLSAVYNNETSLTCTVAANQPMLSGSGSSETVDVTLLWSGPEITDHPIDEINAANVILYDCNRLAVGCSPCIASNLERGFECGYCNRPDGMTDECAFTGNCESANGEKFITSGGQCPAPTITEITPTSGPLQGGTTITITGSELGVMFSDFQSDSIIIAEANCVPIEAGFVPGTQVRCVTEPFNTPGEKTVVLTLNRDEGTGRTTFTNFVVAVPTVSSVSPTVGPMAGGSTLTVSGTDLNIGNTENTRVTLNGSDALECAIQTSSIMEGQITCISPAFDGAVPFTGTVVVHIDNADVDNNVQFMYRNNPNFTEVTPTVTIPTGGITLYFFGNNLDVIQSPILRVTDPQHNNGSVVDSVCTVVNSTTIRCLTPQLTSSPQTADPDGIMYTLLVDNAPGPDPSELRITVRPNPTDFMLDTQEIQTGADSQFIQISGTNLDSIVDKNEFVVTVGDQRCNVTGSPSDNSGLLCVPPLEPPGGDNMPRVMLSVGTNNTLTFDLGTITYVEPSTAGGIPIEIIVPVVGGSFLILLVLMAIVLCCAYCAYRSKNRKNEMKWTNLLSQMELLEMEMADECKRAFTELQTDLQDLVQIHDRNLPYRDFRSFAMRVLFPQAGDDHPVLHPLKLPEKNDQELVMRNLESFKQLVLDKKFLLVFVRTLESQGQRFALTDKCTVASLLMVVFQNNLEYATDVLQTLLSELMRKTVTKSHPKLLLRRTESVAEKMLANWLAFLLYPYILEHLGEHLFVLFRATKSQLEKGPVDVLTGEAKNSLSEEKLLRQHFDVKSVEGVIETESGEEIPIKLLDCDSITQAKEKVLDVLYKNTPVSKRPQLTEVDLTLIRGSASVALRDQDQTNTRDGEWTKVNTLGHYNVDDMSQKHIDNPKLPIPKFKLVARSERPVSGMSFDTLGTIIANIGVASRTSIVSSSDLAHVYHLVKPEVDEGEDGEKRGKIMSEVFLTRLLSTKRILQSYVNDLFLSIFAVPHGRPLPKAIKYLFDFLDLQAAELNIQDPEVLHTWKTNSVALRLWVNLIKNPDFIFDIHKSATVDSCLTVIAQAYIDACSTAEVKYTKDTPSARLLYVNEVKKYKHDVQQYYQTVQSLPKLSQYEMNEYLRETAQVCAKSVEQYDPDTAKLDPPPASMTRQLYFVTESALYELFKFAAEYSDEIVDNLNEDGLSTLASNFQHIKSSLRI